MPKMKPKTAFVLTTLEAPLMLGAGLMLGASSGLPELPDVALWVIGGAAMLFNVSTYWSHRRVARALDQDELRATPADA